MVLVEFKNYDSEEVGKDEVNQTRNYLTNPARRRSGTGRRQARPAGPVVPGLRRPDPALRERRVAAPCPGRARRIHPGLTSAITLVWGW